MNIDKDQRLEAEPVEPVEDLIFEDLEERNVQGWECGCTSTSDCCCCCVYTF